MRSSGSAWTRIGSVAFFVSRRAAAAWIKAFSDEFPA
ncbi:hypothetical protein H4696_003880 [Amycolatopsis lexingtonensis]|uniref:LysR family transcriptional regulator n=1 Tax=Amycolatopsis lexingtonensis TaxID=218822 RepID=A0ABR9I0S9_9PSEU|nr:hypothetical protein [Amycolatopsis lexingtonensis]